MCVSLVCVYLSIKSVCPRLCCHLQLWARTKMEALLRGAGSGQKVSDRKTHHNFSSTHSDDNYATLEGNIYVCKPCFYWVHQKDREKVGVKKKKYFSLNWVMLINTMRLLKILNFTVITSIFSINELIVLPCLFILGQMSTLRVRYLTPKRPLIVSPSSLLARGQQDVWPGSN